MLNVHFLYVLSTFCTSVFATDLVLQPRIGIFVHGFNTFANGWDSTVWGDMHEDRMGRISQAIAVFSMLRTLSAASHQNQAENVDSIVSVLWGSGVPSRIQGVTEGQYTMRVLQERFGHLRSFSFFSKMSDKQINELESSVFKISASEDCSINTVTEIEAAFKHFESTGVNVVVLVSSATHAPRCLRDACRILEGWKSSRVKEAYPVSLEDRATSLWKPILIVAPASTCFEGCSAGDVIIAEPPHLPHSSPGAEDEDASLSSLEHSNERESVEVNRANEANILSHASQLERNCLISRIMKLSKNELPEFNALLGNLLKSYAV